MMANRHGPAGILRRQALGALVAVSAALTGGAALAQTKGGDVIVAQGSNPPSLDGMVTSSQASRNITMHIYETLFGFSEDVRPIPILAETVEISADGLTYRFPLRKGVKFHNGKEMTAADVKASLERYRKVGATGNLLDPVASIEVTGTHEVTFTLKAKTPTFLEAFSSPRAPAVIIPAEDAGAEPGKTSLVGTGPYRFVEYVPDSHVKLARFDDYAVDERSPGPDGFGGRKIAYFDTVTFRIMPEAGARIAALETGEVHVLEQIPVPAGRRLASNPAIATYENMPWAFLTFIMNANVPPTDNVKFREAVQVALNMEEVAAIATEGLFRLDHGWQYVGTTYAAGEIGKEYYNQSNLDRAKALLAEAGYKGEEFVLLTDSTIPEHNKSGVVIAGQLQAAGINAKINLVDWPTALKIRLQPEGWNGWTLMMGIEPYLGPVGVVAPLTGAKPHFIRNDPKLDALYKELTAGESVAARQATFAKIQAALYSYFGIVKIGDAGIMQAARANVKGFKPFRFPRMYGVWFEG
jgi:peptide/nickel transport system substrate-binding protein